MPRKSLGGESVGNRYDLCAEAGPRGLIEGHIGPQ